MEKVTNNFAYEETLKYFKGDDLKPEFGLQNMP